MAGAMFSSMGRHTPSTSRARSPVTTSRPGEHASAQQASKHAALQALAAKLPSAASMRAAWKCSAAPSPRASSG